MARKRTEMGGPAEEAFGRLLRRLRRERGWSQEELAESSDTTRGYISLLERGINSPSLSKLVDLARAFGIRPSQMLADIEAALPENNSDSRE